MTDPKEIQAVIDRFEEFMAGPKTREVRCRVCLSSHRIELNRAMLTRSKSDHAIAKILGIAVGSVRHHRVDCLVTRGGAKMRDVAASTDPTQRKRFPITAKEVTQRKWFLDELMFLRDEAQKKSPLDRKELFKLAKEINAAAEEYRRARAEARAESKPQSQPTEEEDLDLSPAQKAEMERVNRKQEVNSADTH